MLKNKISIKTLENFSIDHVSNTTKNTPCQLHQTYELCFFSAGHRTYMINDNMYNIVPNTLLIIPPYTQHSTFGTTEATRTVIYFTRSYLLEFFTPQFVDSLLQDISSTLCVLTHPRDNISSLVDSIMNTHFQNQTTPTMLNFALLLDAFKSAQKLPQKETSDLTNGIVGRTISYIEKNLGTITSLNELSNHINASLSYLEASFKKSIGLSLMQYIIKSRINLATKKLIETKSSINQVALDCGFNSSTHFSNTFKKHTGFSPRYYRQLYKTKKTQS